MSLFAQSRSVFISATTQGLGPWRQNLKDLLIRQEIQPLEQAYFDPASQRVREEIAQKIALASGVICLVGPYYGWPYEGPRSDHRPRLSFTQWELERTQDRGTPCRIYLIEDTFLSAQELAEGHRQESESGIADADHFREWQARFRAQVKTRFAYKTITSPTALWRELAMINWRHWP